MTKEAFAHSLPGNPPEEWQPLKDHLVQVASLAQAFAAKFNAGDWAYLAGLWHDLGKFSKEFQNLLLEFDTTYGDNNRRGSVDHSTAGARHAFSVWSDAGKIIAYLIAGHHSGLPDGKSSSRSDLASRLDPQRKIPDISNACPVILQPDRKPSITFRQEGGRIGFQVAFFSRMLFSCLVDADFLDTEKFLDHHRHLQRAGRPDLPDLEKRLFYKLRSFKPDSDINKQRAAVLQACIDAAAKMPGLFTLTVPTGGGKTLSSLAFALRHAKLFNKDRVIYVIPFTSIIEQNAAVFRSVLGQEAVLEHHSNYGLEKEDEDETESHRLACENWNAPLVVTTNVQFFDSLFANRSSKCRKLHNIVNSVIILDEAQMLPETYLRPCMETTRELTVNYGCTVVLCTATQPALTKTPTFPYGLPASSITEMIPDPGNLHIAFKQLRLVRLNMVGQLSNDQLAARIADQSRALCIVNTRKRAADLFQLIRNFPGAFHLSARMCPAHRSQVLAKIRECLDTGQDCRVISTQLVEAGVDVDFPVVYREMAGLDSIAQAAGRCNRNAKMDYGEVFVFLPEDGRLPKLFRRAAGAADSVLRRFKDPLAPDAINAYFAQTYWIAGDELDRKQILANLESGVRVCDFPFRQIAHLFNLIESDMVPVIVPYDARAEKLIEKLENAEFPGSVLRRLQVYIVQIYPKELDELQNFGAIRLIHDRYAVLISLVPFYRPDSGLGVEQVEMSPEDFFL